MIKRFVHSTHGVLRRKLPLLSPSAAVNPMALSWEVHSQSSIPVVWHRRFAAASSGDPPDQKRRPRRRKQKYEKFNDAKLAAGAMPVAAAATTSSLETPFEYSGDTIEDYKKKTELSPWTPVPDSVARKIFDRAIPEEDESSDRSKEGEVHVELGSGDGRVNFHAIEYGVRESIGIEVDEDVIKRAEERLNRIHPRPNLEFIVSDLTDPYSSAWTEHVPRATILTMYFAADGLQKIRPHLEQALRGKKCKIFTCGYAMPGWESQIVETVLDIPIFFYDWGNKSVNMMAMQPSDSVLDSLPKQQQKQAVAPSDNMDQYMGRKNKNSNFVEDPLPGYHPDDLIDYGWMDDFSNDETENDDEKKKNDEGSPPNATSKEKPKKQSRIELLHNFKPPTK